MTKGLYIAGAAAAALFAMPFAASAVPTVTLLNSSTQGAGNTAGGYGANYNGTTPMGATWSGGTAPVVTPTPGNSDGHFQSPFNNTGLLDTQSYFSVGGEDNGNGGPSPMTLTYDSLQNDFTFLWGSIDSYNTISFDDAANSSWTGTIIDEMFSELSGVADNYEQVALLSFNFGPNDGFQNVTFTSTQAAFEFALPSAVPLPAAAWMLISAIAGLGFVSSRRRRAAA